MGLGTSSPTRWRRILKLLKEGMDDVSVPANDIGAVRQVPVSGSLSLDSEGTWSLIAVAIGEMSSSN